MLNKTKTSMKIILNNCSERLSVLIICMQSILFGCHRMELESEMFHRGILLSVFSTMGEDMVNISICEQGECVARRTLFSLHRLTKSPQF